MFGDKTSLPYKGAKLPITVRTTILVYSLVFSPPSSGKGRLLSKGCPLLPGDDFSTHPVTRIQSLEGSVNPKWVVPVVKMIEAKNGIQWWISNTWYLLDQNRSNMYMGVSKKIGYPQITHFQRVFHYKPSILGYPYFWKHPYINVLCLNNCWYSFWSMAHIAKKERLSRLLPS